MLFQILEGIMLLVGYLELCSQVILCVGVCIHTFFNKNFGASRRREKTCTHGLFGYLSISIPEQNCGNEFLKTFQKSKKHDNSLT